MTIDESVSVDQAAPVSGSPLDAAIRRVANDLHRLNNSIAQAVEAGVTVELLRCSRYHCGTGRWGDQMVPVIKVAEIQPQ